MTIAMWQWVLGALLVWAFVGMIAASVFVLILRGEIRRHEQARAVPDDGRAIWWEIDDDSVGGVRVRERDPNAVLWQAWYRNGRMGWTVLPRMVEGRLMHPIDTTETHESRAAAVNAWLHARQETTR